MPRVPPVIKIVLLHKKHIIPACAHADSVPIPMTNYPWIHRGIVHQSGRTHGAHGSCGTALTGPIRQARVSGSYCL